MKTPKQSIPIEEILKKYPIKGVTIGWYFRIKEISNNGWEAEGIDKWGRMVYRQGGNPTELLSICETEAQKINEQLKNI